MYVQYLEQVRCHVRERVIRGLACRYEGEHVNDSRYTGHLSINA